jgi:site-specific DNA-adenine methylase
MWSYYGRKMKIINEYPQPEHDTIIEPFAGTASYAYKYWGHDVILVDKYDVIIKVWKYLQQASPNDILQLPDVESGEFIGDKYEWLCDEERWLIGFCINNGSQRPKHTAGRMNFNSWGRDKHRIANDLHKIRHWKLILGDYRTIANFPATWYIDPPYQFQHEYVHNNIDYTTLAEWCKSRQGQVIVCENSHANWMNFKPLISLYGQRTRTLEVMWYRE